MPPRSTLVPALSCVLLAACAAPPAPERTGVERAPVVSGVPDTFRSYVVGVGNPYDVTTPGLTPGPFCSGTLVSRRTVVTAGHCVSPEMGAQGGITAIFFGPDITSPLPDGAVIVGTVKTLRHPGFDPRRLSNDLAVVELAADAPSQPAPLLRETMDDSPTYVGPYFTLAGYGNDGNQDYGLRRAVVLPIVAVGPDATVGRDTGSGPIDATEFYYRVPDKNTCDGDSGGPAFLPRDHVERLAGATSGGDAACKIDGVDARADAPQIAAFLQASIDAFEGEDPCRADGICNESCNTGQDLVDPDCAPAHCGADGICALSCVDPPDPDCPVVDHCGADGVCDPSCSPTDVDCLPPPETDAGSSADAGNRAADAERGTAERARSAGCSMAPASDDGAAFLALAAGLAGLAWKRRRQRGRP